MNKDIIGLTGRDKVTGVEGVIVAITTYLSGCDRVSLQPREIKDGKPADWVTIDINLLQLLDNERVMVNEALPDAPPIRRVGGPQPAIEKW